MQMCGASQHQLAAWLKHAKELRLLSSPRSSQERPSTFGSSPESNSVIDLLRFTHSCLLALSHLSARLPHTTSSSACCGAVHIRGRLTSSVQTVKLNSMRLLYVDTDGRLCCTKDYIVEREIPSYAILSHTWKEDQEVTFADLQYVGNVENITAQHDEGYRKIRFCAQQAKRDNLEYFWIDSCCIDKSNHAELSKAINSMFRWYQNADKCYVYLADVENGSEDSDELVRRWKPNFKKSRWFTRGWTLQELLAPKTVEFYSADAVRLGDKISLRQTISEITGIPEPALTGSSLFVFNIDERFSWAANRHTTHEEDEAYCLLGIFGIHLPLIYGEGKENAHKRLRREIRQFQDDERNDGGISNTDQAILSEICRWLAAPNPHTNYHKALTQRQAETGLWLLENDTFFKWKTNSASLLWLYGIPGCGKTILSSTIIENLQQHCGDNSGTATVYFFFDFKDGQKQDPEFMLRSLLHQVLQQTHAIPYSLNALYLLCKDGQQQVSLQALLEVVEQAMKDLKRIYVVLDALDECKQRSELLDVLRTVAKWRLHNLHLLMTSRKEKEIESSLEDYVHADCQICLQSDVVDKDISRYVQQRLSSDKSLIKWSQDIAIRQEIEVALMRGAHGM
jgi:KaiC/GvpD/RAD55 family RecA-like ATPase